MISLLVPWRPESDPHRTVLWDWIRGRWSHVLPEAEIVEGHDEGFPFSRTVAVNDAALKATGDVFIICDADAWMEREAITEAIEEATETGRFVTPWTQVLRMRPDDTDRFLEVGPTAELSFDGLRRGAPTPPPATGATLGVITRAAFWEVCGMDPRFRGWGHEDVAFSLACERLIGRKGLQNTCYSLWHARPELRGNRVWEEEDGTQRAYNRALVDRYVRSSRVLAGMRMLCDEHPIGEEPKPWVDPAARRRVRA